MITTCGNGKCPMKEQCFRFSNASNSVLFFDKHKGFFTCAYFREKPNSVFKIYMEGIMPKYVMKLANKTVKKLAKQTDN